MVISEIFSLSLKKRHLKIIFFLTTAFKYIHPFEIFEGIKKWREKIRQIECPKIEPNNKLFWAF